MRGRGGEEKEKGGGDTRHAGAFRGVTARYRREVSPGLNKSWVARLAKRCSEKHEISIKETSLIMRPAGFIGSKSRGA